MRAQLPPAPWTNRADLAALVAALGEANLRWVGGAVRDTLLGDAVGDIDAATTLSPAEVIAALGAAGIRSVPTGIEHGTVTALLDGGPVEVTTLRRDVATDGRRATVAFSADWREDAARRDFTINALYAHPQTLVIEDYFGGIDDLAARRVRFIGNAHDRIREDHLRILRYFRFQARFGGIVDPATEQACAELAATLKGISRERIARELLLLLGLPAPSPVVQQMRELGVLPVVLPEAGAHELAALGALEGEEARQGVAPDAIRRLAALLPALAPVAETVAARLRLSRVQRQRLVSAAERSIGDGAQPRALAYREGVEQARDRLLLLGADTGALKGWSPPELPLKGGEIVARGIGAGPEIARILQAIERRWIEEGFPPRLRVESMLDEALDEALAQRDE